MLLGSRSAAAARLLLLALLACTAVFVRAGEPDSFLGPRPIRSDALTLLPRDFRQALQAGTNWESLFLSSYPSNTQLAQWTADFVSRCGSIARRFSIGKSVGGVDLWVVEISANPGKVEAKPNFRYIANMHGDETSGRMLLPMMAEWLCNNRATDPRASRIIDNMHLFLMPTMNPDGFAANSRANKAGKDLNRNFNSPFTLASCKGKQPELCSPAALAVTSSNTQPETRAVMAWMLNTSWPFTAAANFHDGATVVNYPWDGYDDGTTSVLGVVNAAPDHAAYVHMSKAYSKAHRTMGSSSQFADGITNGAAWYPIYGSLQDWTYMGAGCLEVTVEISVRKRPATTSLPGIWSDNLNAIVNFPIAAALGGVFGTVTNAAGSPLTGAIVTVAGNTLPTTARGPLAYFNKPLAPGTYSLSVSAPGAQTATATVVVPADGSGVRRDFVLA